MKKGFTLIELLAVIVILAIIALIASPIIIGLIDDARKEAFNTSAYGIIDAGEILYSKDLLKGTNDEVTFTYTNGVETSSIPGKKLDYNGTKPKSGTVKINSEGQIAIAIHNGTYCTVKGYEDSEATLSDKTEAECVIPLPCGTDLVDSRDSNTYKIVQIGEQCWMAENLRYTGNGCTSKTWNDTDPHDACMKATEAELTANETYRQWLKDEVLYQWGAAMNGSTTEGAQGICPDGWHIPTDAEWTTLVSFVGATPGTKLKAETPIWDGSDTVRFNALPAGNRATDGSLVDVGSAGDWWTSLRSNPYDWAWFRDLYSGSSVVYRINNSQAKGNAVRCLLGQ